MTGNIHTIPRTRQRGPVTVAIAAMQQLVDTDERSRLQALRRAIADRIEADLALLDALDGDPDLDADQVVMIDGPDGLMCMATPCDDEGAACEDERFGR